MEEAPLHVDRETLPAGVLYQVGRLQTYDRQGLLVGPGKSASQ